MGGSVANRPLEAALPLPESPGCCAVAQISRGLTLGAGGLLVGLAAVLVWAWLAPIGGAVIASGQVTVEGYRRPVQHLEGGIVKQVLVRDGQAVAAGQALIELDPTRADASFDGLQRQYFENRVREARLLAESTGKETFEPPEEAVARSERPEIAQIVAVEDDLFRVRRHAVTLQQRNVLQQIAETRAGIEGAKAERIAKDRQSKLVARELGMYRKIYEQGYAPVTRVLALERGLAETEGLRDQAQAKIAQLTERLRAQELELQRLGNDYRVRAVDELAQVRAALGQLEKQIGSARDLLDRTHIRAPEGGVILGLKVTTAGAVIAPGQILAEIVPGNAPLVVEARVQPRDIERVRSGADASLRVLAFNRVEVGLVEASVTQVSADRIDEQRGGAAYLVRLTPKAGAVQAAGGASLSPGMPVEAFISTGSRTAIAYLLEPVLDALDRSMRER